MGAAFLATSLDELMLNGKIAAKGTPDVALPIRTGDEVADELGGRMLLRYVCEPDETSKSTLTFVCPTPYSPEEALGYLALPSLRTPRKWVVVLNPRRIPNIQGPRWCAMGQGIEYLLPDGYTTAAIANPGWAIEVR